MNAFYFAYGNKGFGDELNTESSHLKVNFKDSEGCGIAFRKFQEFNGEFPQNFDFKVENCTNNDVTIELEKKFGNRIKREQEIIPANTARDFNIIFYRGEADLLQEFVIAALKGENKNVSDLDLFVTVKQ